LTTLIGLDNGKLFDKDARLGNLSLEQAFRADSLDFFKNLALNLGKDTIDRRIVSIAYGNMDTSGTADSLSKLTISPDEQLGLAKKMYFNQLHFQKRTVDVVKDIMQRESTPNYSLAYVTGSAKDSSGAPIVWVLGWEEERKNPYFFVLNITGTPDEDLSAKAEPLLRALLTDQGFFKGLK
jgi:beta-lactamase class D